MKRERNKPTQPWVDKVKYELEHEEELTIERAYELGKIRGEKEQKAIDDEELGKALLYCTNKTTERVKKEMIDKACKWLINTYLGDYVTDEYGNGGIGDNVKLAEDFRKAMGEEL